MLAKTLAAWAAVFLSGLMAINTSPVAANEGSGASAKADSKEMRKALDKLLDSLAACRESIPRETFDPQAIVANVGKDPQKLFKWVRDNTIWVPYRGALRGSRGVLMDRMGNSLDRAWLLADLLRQAGCHVRLARCELDVKAGSSLLVKALGADLPAPTAAPAVPAKGDKRALLAAKVSMDRKAEEAAIRIAEQTAWLKKIVGSLPAPGADPRPLAAIRDHWWVQARQDEKWVDLDLMGAAATKPAETVELDKDGNLPPKSPYGQLVQIRLIIEQWNKGKLKESPVLDVTVRPWEVLDDAIVLRHQVQTLAKTDADTTKTDSTNMRKSLLAVTGWVPVLEVNGKPCYKSGFDDAGEVVADPEPTAEAKVSQANGDVAGGLGGMLGGGDDTPAPATSILTAEWIEYKIQSPGAKARTIRRPIFDVLGPAARTNGAASFDLTEAARFERSCALIGEVKILCVPCNIADDFVLAGHLQKLRESLLQIRKLSQGESVDLQEVRRQWNKAFDGMNTPLYRWAMARQAWSRNADGMFLSQPNIVQFGQTLRPDAAGKFAGLWTIDVVANDIAFRKAESAVDLRLSQGVVDAVAEASSLSPFPGGDTTCRLVALSEAQKVTWRLARAAKDLRGQKIRADVRERIEQTLARGDVVVLPNKPLDLGGRKRFGWWDIDPRTGQTLAVLDSGLNGNEEVQALMSQIIAAGDRFGAVVIVERLEVYMAMTQFEFAEAMGANTLAGFMRLAPLWQNIQAYRATLGGG